MVDPMPILLFGLVGAAAYLGYRQLRQETARVVERNRRTEAETRTGAHGTLERGADGVYRIRRD
ncbi:hypothetical protein D3218_16675 [Aureimonas flava]|uniref:Uncharacterized protein n=1 Tax=Aureimonas flava TaxID=2320271 RepID=A0A3A1WJ05_9HYPH|nr:hypothetical protein [Aureimonas flava]RIX98813.1 hypothetical protein D3218_16675 [Aureimonas flava]